MKKKLEYLFIVLRKIQSNPMNLLSRISSRTWWTPISGTSIIAKNIFGARVGQFTLDKREMENKQTNKQNDQLVLKLSV